MDPVDSARTTDTGSSFVTRRGELERFASTLLEAGGADGMDAHQVAEALVWADMRARYSHGVIRVPMYLERLQRGLISSPAVMQFSHVGLAAEMLDAGNAFGQVAGRAAMERAVELARAGGVGIVTVRHSNHYSAAGYFCALAAEAGAIGMAFTNAAPKVAAFGGTRRVLGTNPIAFGVPTSSGVPVLADLSTSAISGGSTRSMDTTGSRLPDGVALDEHGQPTNDAAAADKGALLPAGGPIGFCLALLVEILCGVLAGAGMAREVGSLFSYDRPINAGHAFLAIDIAAFQPLDQFLARIDSLLRWVKRSSDDEGAVRVPGELRGIYAERFEQDGVPLPEESVTSLLALARRLGVDPPWEPGRTPRSDRSLL